MNSRCTTRPLHHRMSSGCEPYTWPLQHGGLMNHGEAKMDCSMHARPPKNIAEIENWSVLQCDISHTSLGLRWIGVDVESCRWCRVPMNILIERMTRGF